MNKLQDQSEKSFSNQLVQMSESKQGQFKSRKVDRKVVERVSEEKPTEIAKRLTQREIIKMVKGLIENSFKKIETSVLDDVEDDVDLDSLNDALKEFANNQAQKLMLRKYAPYTYMFNLSLMLSINKWLENKYTAIRENFLDQHDGLLETLKKELRQAARLALRDTHPTDYTRLNLGNLIERKFDALGRKVERLISRSFAKLRMNNVKLNKLVASLPSVQRHNRKAEVQQYAFVDEEDDWALMTTAQRNAVYTSAINYINVTLPNGVAENPGNEGPKIESVNISDEVFNSRYVQRAYSLLRYEMSSKRNVYTRKNKIVQDPIRSFNRFSQYLDSPAIIFQSMFWPRLLQNLITAIYEIPSVDTFNIKMLYVYQHKEEGRHIVNDAKFMHPKQPFTSQRTNQASGQEIYDDFCVMLSDSDPPPYFIVGYHLIYETDTDNHVPSNNQLNKLRAYSATTNHKFHKLTVASTSCNAVCIYETFRHIFLGDKLRYSRRGNALYRQNIYNQLAAEGADIEKAVKGGYLIKALELLTKKYKVSTLVPFFGTTVEAQLIKGKIILVDNGVATAKPTIEQLSTFLNKEVFLYHAKDLHVAPTVFTIQASHVVDMATKDKYVLRPKNLKNKKQKIQSVLSYDIESYKTSNGYQKPYCICMYGHLGDITDVEQKFYGFDCVNQFVDYLISISTPKNLSKTQAKVSVKDIMIYGFNNSKYDNLLVYNAIHNKVPYMKACFAANSIKYIKFDNVLIQDLNLYYPGSLRSVGNSFGITKEKGVFPYEFMTDDNVYYIGEIPELKYWNNQDDLDEYVKEQVKDNGFKHHFNVKEYTIKYCILDCQITYEIAMKHLEQCSGTLKGKNYKLHKAPTGAGMAMSMFGQVFQKDNLESDRKYQEIEMSSYFGGRTEVFRKCFTNEDDETKKLMYVDINSAHPASMTILQPYKFERHTPLRRPMTRTRFIPWHLYKCSFRYTGNDPHYISNILVRYNKSVIPVKQADNVWRWGCELNEAVANGCSVVYTEVLEYEGRAIFKEYVEHFYGERLKVKSPKNADGTVNANYNKSKGEFYKLMLNSLYGKFGQKTFDKSVIINHPNEIKNYVNNTTTHLTSFCDVGKKILITYTGSADEFRSVGSLVRFSSYIAATTRCKLSAIMRDVGHDHVYYCDTDSIMTDKKPSAQFLHETELGKWGFELDYIDRAYFLAPKMYYYHGYDGGKEVEAFKGKGIKAELLASTDYKNMFLDPEHKVAQTKKMFYRSYTGVKVADATRRVGTVYNKRIWNEDGSSSSFNTIEDWLESQN